MYTGKGKSWWVVGLGHEVSLWGTYYFPDRDNVNYDLQATTNNLLIWCKKQFAQNFIFKQSNQITYADLLIQLFFHFARSKTMIFRIKGELTS